MRRRVWPFIKNNPIPPIALLGLVCGAVLRWGYRQDVPADWVWLLTLVGGGAPLVWNTLRGMLRGRFASDVVAMLAIVTAVVMREYFAGVIVVLMQSGGEALEAYGLGRASSSLAALMERAPRIAYRKLGDGLEQIAVAEVHVGDTLVVRPGDRIPVDGTLLNGRAEVDESAVTGEPLPRTKQPGDLLLSGSVNVGNAFEMQAEKRSDESQYAKIVQLVRDAQNEKPAIQRLADRYAVWFTPLTLLACGVGWIITGDPRTILAVLVVATPCPLILATPIAIISGINRAAQTGIIVKSGTAIEQVGRARTVVFDKTGTLTFGTPLVEQIVPWNGVPADQLLHAAGSVEQLSSHLLGQTLAHAAQAQWGTLPLPANFREEPGRGVEGDLENRHIVVGSPRFVAERVGVDATLGGRHPEGRADSTGLGAYIAIDRRPVGVARFSDRLRPGVPELMQRLHALGVHSTVLLTGDNLANARAIGQQAGIDTIKADLLPEDKVTALQELKQREQPVVMVGDGINDAPALATATVGVAMGAHGSGISAEAADIVLLVDDVTRVGNAIEIGQHTVRIAKQSIYVGLGLSFALMIVAAFGFLPPPVGALCQEVVDVAAILNALRSR